MPGRFKGGTGKAAHEGRCDGLRTTDLPSASLPSALCRSLQAKRSCEITIISFSRSICRRGLAALIGVTGKPYPGCLSYHSHPICPCGAPSPRGEGYEMRIPSFKKAARHPCEAILSPSTVIPSEAEGSLLHCRHMHTCALTQTTPWCFLFRLSLAHGLPVCKKAPSTSALMIRKKDDSLTSSFTPLRRVVPLRGTLSCAFGAALLQGPTRIIGATGD